MRAVPLLIVVVAACGTEKRPPGAATCTEGADRDADGVCDDVDVCPDAFDPGQVDLDGDGIGWVCDAIEDVTVKPRQGWDVAAIGAVHGSSLSVVLQGGCMNIECEKEFIGATPLGGGTLETSRYGTPLVTSAGALFVDAWGPPGASGLYDPVAHRYHPDLVGDVFSYGLDGDAFAIAQLDHHDGTSEFVMPGDSGLISLGARGSIPPITSGRVPGARQPQTFAFPSHDAAGVHLDTFTVGDTALTPVALPEGASLITSLLDPGTLPRFPDTPYCVEQPGQVSYVGIAHTPTIGAMPFPSCPVVKAVGDRVTGSTLFVYGAQLDDKRSVYTAMHGQLTPFVTDVADGVFDVVGGTLPVLRGYDSTTATWDAWVLDFTGPVQLAHGFAKIAISTHGSTVHVLGLTPASDLVLVRFRNGQAPQQLMLGRVSGIGMPSVVTTAEGAAIVSDNEHSWMVPSMSFTATALTPAAISGAARGNATVILGKEQGTNRAQLFAYDERGGTPHFTALNEFSNDTGLAIIDPQDGPPSDWFAYGASGLCNLAQIVYNGDTPTLAHQLACTYEPDLLNVYGWERTASGDLVVEIDGPGNEAYSIYTLGADTATKAISVPAPHETYDLRVELDTSVWPPVVVGWGGTDPSGGFECLARQPDRCWSVPTTAGSPMSVVAGHGENAGDSLARIWYPAGTGDDSTTHVVIMHAVGPGDRPPPM